MHYLLETTTISIGQRVLVVLINLSSQTILTCVDIRNA